MVKKSESYAEFIKKREKKHDKATKKEPDSKFTKFRKNMERMLRRTMKK